MFKNGMRPIHPGEILWEDYIEPTGTSVRAVALVLHIPYSHLSEIVKGRRGMTADTALRLERYFGNEAQCWLNLQTAYDLRMAETLVGKTKAMKVQITGEANNAESGINARRRRAGGGRRLSSARHYSLSKSHTLLAITDARRTGTALPS
ncbi:HigA family addiction module antitoxin [Duganella radicis]|uniref:HigA family addiction module antidote protein n=1 Tax=Duganella radicis TaxID=551988 RepID=A0A6L6PLI3_9BURK|nr:HigA family addiction module antitoxin [Duganella radicis]MTV39948.1 HigA family addiction module antidote protein [Duganella radicis]